MKECTVILGMHRSGTSALAGLVSLFGSYVGTDLMPSTNDNPKGYFENNKIYQFNEKILRENNTSWDDFLFSIDDIDEIKIKEYICQAKSLVENDLKYVKQILIKDPRICILFPIWEQALNELNIKIKIILIYRSPMEVASSLKIRDEIPIEKGLMLWSHYLLESEYYSRSYKRIVVEYDNDFKNLPVLLELIAKFLDLEVSDEITSQASSFYAPSLKHHKISLANISNDLPSYLVNLINLLIENNFSNYEMFDELKNEFFNSKKYYLYNYKQLLDDNFEKEEKLDKQDNELEQKSNELKLEKKSNGLELEQKNNELGQKNNELEQKSNELEQKSNELEDKNKIIEKKEHELLNYATEKNNLVESRKRVDKLSLYLSNGDEIFKDLMSNKIFYNKLYQTIGGGLQSNKNKLLLLFSSKKDKKLKAEKKLIINSGLFSEFYYFSRYPDIWKARVDPLIHYCHVGWKEDRKPSSKFDSVVYKNKHPEVARENINPLLHYIRSKNDKSTVVTTKIDNSSKKSHLKFDTEYYLKNNPDVAKNGINPYKHFTDIGWKERRDPNIHFSVDFYIKTNPDVKRAGINPFFHYVSKGYDENRLPKLTEKIRSIQPLNSSPSILFVGHSGAQGGAEVVLLDIIQWYAKNTSYKISVILLSPGILAGHFMHYGKVLTLNSADELTSQESAVFLDFHYNLIYLNTVVSGDFAPIYKKKYAKLDIPIVLHVHEMKNIIDINKNSFDAIVDDVDLFLAASTRVKEDLVSYYNVSPKKISVHHSFVQNNATNANKLSRQVSEAREYFQLNDDDFVIMGSGTANWRKAPDLFVETLVKIIKQCRGKNIVGIWMGAGEELEALKIEVSRQGLTDNIRFTGFLTNASKLVAAADIFFLSSREDPFPLVCLEAAQYSIPSICFQPATGMVEFIKEDAGLAIAEIDTDRAASEIVNLMKDEARREQLGFVARKRFMTQYSSESQIQTIFHQLKQCYSFKPSVTTIIPNYNHATYLKERIDSVVQQSFYDQEILILDDASIDNSLAVIARYKNDPRITLMTNKKSSGSPFKQWQKGIMKAKADCIWIAESDDTASENLLSTLLSAFKDKNLVLSYCKSEIIDEKGKLIPNALTPYMQRAHPTKFNAPYSMEGNKEVEQNFAVACTIVNASSVVFRKNAVCDSLNQAMKFKMCGDWFIYLHALYNGRIAYSTEATNYFRRHQSSTVHKVEGTELYFKERFTISKEVLRKFNITENVFNKMLQEVDSEWERFKHIDKEQSYETLFDKAQLQDSFKKNTVTPLIIGFYVHGFLFSKGGIERLAADLANYLSSRGHKIIIYCRVSNRSKAIYDVNKEVSIVPIFDESKANRKAATKRLREELKNTKLDVFVPMLSEWIFSPVIEAASKLGFPIIASEHNNPEVIENQWWSHKERVEAFEQVDTIHLLRENYKDSLPQHLQKNIRIIQNGSYLGRWTTKKNNKTYKRLISVGRLAPQKRFDRLIHAFALVAEKIDKDWQLDIYGEGPDQKELQHLIDFYELNGRIVLKGNNNHIEREYFSSDLFVLPSAFEGDPVVLVEAKMFGLPCIGYADCPGTNEAIHDHIDGLLVETDEDGRHLASAMIELINNNEQRKQFGLAAKRDSERLSMNIIAQQWEQLLVNACSSLKK